MNLSDLQNALDQLSTAMLADPLLSLCNAIAWLDPLITNPHLFSEDLNPYDGNFDHWTNIGVAWETARACFLDVYAETTLNIRSQQQTEIQIAEQVCIGINRHLIRADIYELDQIHYGLPFAGGGVEITSQEFFADPMNTPLMEVYGMFDVEVGHADLYSYPDHYDQAATSARVIAHSLRLTDQPAYDDLAGLLDWMFAQTGNASADYTDEEFYDMNAEPLRWEPYDIAYSNAMHAEAFDMIEQARRGLQFLMHQPALKQTLSRNIQKIATKVRKVKRYDLHDTHAHQLAKSLRWTHDPEPTDANRTPDDLESVSFWGADAA